jgi:hypothetical protein
LPVARSRSSGPLGALLSSPALDVRLMTALQVLQVLQKDARRPNTGHGTGAHILRSKQEKGPSGGVDPTGAGAGRPGGGVVIGDAVAKGECVSSRVLVWCLLAPSRGGVLKLRGNPVHGANPRRPVFTLRPFPCERAPPGLGLSCPQPDANHPARWVRFLAPRPWM